MLAACHIVHVMGLDFLLLVLPCTDFLYARSQYKEEQVTSQDTRRQYKEEQVTKNPTPSHVQHDMLPTYFKNNYRLKATLLGTNLLSDDGFI